MFPIPEVDFLETESTVNTKTEQTHVVLLRVLFRFEFSTEGSCKFSGPLIKVLCERT